MTCLQKFEMRPASLQIFGINGSDMLVGTYQQCSNLDSIADGMYYFLQVCITHFLKTRPMREDCIWLGRRTFIQGVALTSRPVSFVSR